MVTLMSLWESQYMTDYKLIELTKSNIRKYLYPMLDMGQEARHKAGREFKNVDFNLVKYVTESTTRVVVCEADGRLVGFMFCFLGESLFDSRVKILQQDLLYTKSKRATYLLLKDFIDFGKRNANHVVTMIGPDTNIKGESLEKLGFKHIESMYRMEI